MWAPGIIIAGLIILWGIEIHFKLVSDRITVQEIIIKQLEEDVGNLGRDLKVLKK